MSEPRLPVLAIVGGNERASDLRALTTVLLFPLRGHDGDRDLERLRAALEARSIDIVVLMVEGLEAHNMDAVIDAFAAAPAPITFEIVNSSCSITFEQVRALATNDSASTHRPSRVPRLTTLTSQIA
jgi:hypothetical protein